MQQNMVVAVVMAVVLAIMIGVIQFKKNKISKQGQSFSLVLTALLVAISVILAQFRVYIPLFGFPSVRFSLSEIPIFLAGALLGGVYGAMAGFTSDIISFMIASAGPYHFGFTLNLMLVGFLPGVIFSLIRQDKISVPFDKLNKLLGGIALIGSLIYINFIGIKDLDEVLKIGPFPANIVLSIVMVTIILGTGYGIHQLKKNHAGNEGLYSIDQLIFAICINYVIVNLVLTPTWLWQLYNIPVAASVIVRIFKSVIDVILQVIIIYIVIHAIPVRMREKIS